MSVRDGIPSWFTPTASTALEHVEHPLGTDAPGETAAAADVVIALLGSVEPRSGRAGPQVTVVTDRGWRVMYDCAHGHRIRVTYPPADAPLVEESCCAPTTRSASSDRRSAQHHRPGRRCTVTADRMHQSSATCTVADMDTRAAVVLGTAGMVGALAFGAMTGGEAADAARIQAAKPYALRCLANPAPRATFTYSPAVPVAGEPLVLTSTTFDTSRPMVAAAYAWSVDGRAVAGNVRQAVVTSVAGGMRTVTLHAFDGCARGTATLPLFVATKSALNKAQTVSFERSAKSLAVTLGPYPETVSGLATAKLGSRTLGRGRVTMNAGKTRKVKMTLSSAGRKALASRRTAKVKVASVLTTASGRSLKTSRTVTVRRR